ncbi:hypothetical protein [Halopelagius fulvigenes]|uniref:Uncharacterized protein n=1 Tax=Halopelagius fulvigenes TaxID=1198324 RepID=A0ABD5TVF3_9EURY
MSYDGGRTPEDDSPSDDFHNVPDSTTIEGTYVRNDEGQMTMADRSSEDEGVDETEAAGIGIAGTLILIGAVLFLFPEPVSSVAGALLITGGIILWAVEQFS